MAFYDSLENKQCTKCKEFLTLDNFYKRSDLNHIYHSWCKKCGQVAKASYRKNNPKKHAEYSKNWRIRNPEKSKEVFYKWANANPDKVKQNNINYVKNNAGKVCEKVMRRYTKKMLACPKWLSSEQLQEIKNIYIRCSILSKETGILYNVDHIIPLVSDKVCGLHVPWNLQILEARVNRSKGNRFNDIL